ncbi:MAG: hypothetical protein RLZZ608_70 [Actinomycetota bacterium]|jgi:YVTN family beta-propeller protein
MTANDIRSASTVGRGLDSCLRDVSTGMRRALGLGMLVTVLSLWALPALATSVITTIPVGDFPGSVAITPDGANAYVVNGSSNTVSVISTATNTVTATIPVGDSPSGIAITPDGTTAYIPNAFSNTVSVVTTATNTVTATIPVGEAPTDIAITPDGTTAYVTNAFSGTISIIATASNTVIVAISVGEGPGGVAITPDGATAYVLKYFRRTESGTYENDSMVTVVSVATMSVTDTFSVGDSPNGVAITPDGTTAYVTNSQSNTISAINTATNTVIATIPAGKNPDGDSPGGVDMTPDGTTVYITNDLSDTVSAIDIATNTVTTVIPVGDSPLDVAITPDGTTAYVTNGGNDTVSVIALNTAATMADPTEMPTPVLDTPYSFTVPVTLGSPAATFTVASGALPAGLSLDVTTGVISGTPSTAGPFSVTIEATNTTGTVSATYTGTINAALPDPSDESSPPWALVIAIASAGALALAVVALVLIVRRSRRLTSRE